MMFADKTAIVTGGARGIGYECALKFAAGGATVVLVDVLEDAMKQAAERLAQERALALFPGAEHVNVQPSRTRST